MTTSLATPGLTCRGGVHLFLEALPCLDDLPRPLAWPSDAVCRLAVDRILEACAVKMFRSSLGPNDSDAQLCMKTYDHAKVAKQMAFIKTFGI